MKIGILLSARKPTDGGVYYNKVYLIALQNFTQKKNFILSSEKKIIIFKEFYKGGSNTL